jgi:hypothetical protein
MTDENPTEIPAGEPTVLDWVKSLLRLRPIPIPPLAEKISLEQPAESQIAVPDSLEGVATAPDLIKEEPIIREVTRPSGISLKIALFPAAIFLALIAQLMLEAKPQSLVLPIVLYLFAILIVALLTWKGNLHFSGLQEDAFKGEETGVRLIYLVAGAILSMLTFLASRANRFTPLNLALWAAALFCMLAAFWQGESPLKSRQQRMAAFLKSFSIQIKLGPWQLIWILGFAIVLFFRLSYLDRVPYEMWSDHAEKLLDVMDVLNGQYSIFFPHNTGREAIQFYLAAATAKYLGTGISFLTLKIGTVLAGILTLPYLYLFAKEIGGRYVGLAAFMLAGIGYWPNVISRLGLRFPLYPLFVAPALYYLVRGLRLRRRNDLLLSGVAMGLGLHGYSPARVIPLAAVAGVLIYILHKVAKGRRKETIYWLFAMGMITLVVFLPLLAVMTTMPGIFFDRMATRMTSLEQPLPGPPLQILVGNIWNAFKMFGWDNGEIWVISIPHRPALDWVTAGLFHLGLLIVIVQYLRQRRWQDLFLLISIPILMLPSILSLAFPNENPAPNRAAGAMIPAFILAAIPLALIPQWVNHRWHGKWASRFAISFVLILGYLSAYSNYHLVFDVFAYQHRNSTWNTREMGEVIRGYADSVGEYVTAHVISPEGGNWVDTRLVAMLAGAPQMDYETWVEDLRSVPPVDGPQLFLFKPEDAEAFAKLRELFPEGFAQRKISAVQGRDFMVYFVPPKEDIDIDGIRPEQ